EAYRGQLRLIRDRIDTYWETRAADLVHEVSPKPAEEFARIVRTGLADSAVLGAYPSLPQAPASDPAGERADWRAAQQFEERGNFPAAINSYSAIAKSDANTSLAARAAQGQIRCLLRS